MMANSKYTATTRILQVMYFLAWLAFVGFAIEGGGTLVALVVSFIKPEFLPNLYSGKELIALREYSHWHYDFAISIQLALWSLKALICYMLIIFLTRFRLDNPFNIKVVRSLEQVSYLAFATWLLAVMSNVHLSYLLDETGVLHGAWQSLDFIYLVGILYVVSQVFRRGLEIQSENDLTI